MSQDHATPKPATAKAQKTKTTKPEATKPKATKPKAAPAEAPMPPDLDQLRQDIANCHRSAAISDKDALYADRNGLDRERAARYRQEAGLLNRKLEAQLETRTREIRLIQVGLSAIAMSKDAYRACCRRLSQGRTDSCATLTATERRALLDELKSKGFKPRSKAGPQGGTHSSAPTREDIERRPLLAKIEALLADMDLPWSYAVAILRRQRGHDANPGRARIGTRLQNATDKELTGVIAALWRRAKRQAPRAEHQEDAQG